MGFMNIKDNLYTFDYHKNKPGSLLDELVFEYLYSKNQSGNSPMIVGEEDHFRGRDNYFNHFIHQTG